jgi:hypothetical protein
VRAHSGQAGEGERKVLFLVARQDDDTKAHVTTLASR